MIIIGIFFGSFFNLIFSYNKIIFRDLFAIIFAMLFSLSVYINILNKRNALKFFILSISFGVFIQLIPLILLFFGVYIDSWMNDDGAIGVPFVSRYNGFTTNPNQLGIFLASIPLLLCLMFKEFKNNNTKLILIIATFLSSILLVLLTKSSTAIVSYFFSFLIILLIFTSKKIIIFLYLIISPIFILFSYFFIINEINKNDSDDANGRFPLWNSAIEGLNQSFYMGAGPGSHSGETGPFQNYEAHNVFLDLLLQGGIISFTGYIAIFLYIIYFGLRNNNYYALGLVGTIFIQQLSHYFLRHPIFWVNLILAFALVNSFNKICKLNRF
jgi:O-antigen ligase